MLEGCSTTYTELLPSAAAARQKYPLDDQRRLQQDEQNISRILKEQTNGGNDSEKNIESRRIIQGDEGHLLRQLICFDLHNMLYTFF